MSDIQKSIIQVCKKHNSKPAFTYAENEGYADITYGEYLTAFRNLAADLVSHGIKPGDRVMLLASYGPEWCAAYMAVHFTGAAVIPMDAQYSADEIKTIYSFTEPAAVLYDKAHNEVIPMETETSVCIDRVFSSPEGQTDSAPVPLPAESPMSIIFTSGTTGDPKGVMLSESNFMSNVRFMQHYKGLISEKDVILSILPLHHVYGFTCTFLAPVLTGCTVVFPRTISGADIADAVRSRRVTVLVAVPQVLALFHKKIFETVEKSPFMVRDLFGTMKDVTRWVRRLTPLNPGRILFRKIHSKFPALRYLTSGGARLEPDILKDMRDLGFNIIEAYGLTETSPIACFNHPKRPVPGSVGRAITDVDVKIEKTQKDFDQGEICIKGPNVMMGYFKREEKTEEAVKQGWFHTGDLGYKDNKGNVFITGRKKEVIILPNGKNVYPEELEKMYAGSDRIAEVCILTLEDNGKEQLAAAVYPEMSYFKTKRSGNIHQEVKYDIESIALHLPSYQRVTRVELMHEELPRTRLGKLKRYKIKETIENRSSSREQPDTHMKTETDDPFLVFLMSELDLDFVPSLDHSLETDLGLDSLNKLELFAAVQKRFGIEIGQEEAGEIMSVKNLKDIAGETEDRGSTSAYSLLEEIRRDPETPLSRHVAVGWGMSGGLFRFVGHVVIHLFLRIFMRARIKGIEHIPKEGPFIIAGNHVSYFDALMLYGMLPYRVTRRMYSLSLPEIFDHFPLNIMRKPARIIMTGTHDTMLESLRYSRIVLEKGEPMVIFPEGKRSVNGRVDRPKKGVFLLASEYRAPMVPVYLKGFTQIYSRLNPGFHFAGLQAEVLEPIPAEEDPDRMQDRWLSIMKDKNNEEFSGIADDNM